MRQKGALRDNRTMVSLRGSCIPIHSSRIIFFGLEGLKPENNYLGQPLARASRVGWGIGGLYFTVRDCRRGQ